jgi:hypothetical protein
MTITINVHNRKEGEAIRDGLADPLVRAFVKIIGVLNRLPSDRARARVMRFIWNQVDEDGAASSASAGV